MFSRTTALLLAVCLAAPALAADRRVPDSPQELTLSFAPLVKQAAPAVVNVFSRKAVVERQSVSPLFDDPFFRRFFGDGFPQGQPRERMANSLGSGVIVRPDGVVVTNHHVIAGADSIKVVLADRREFDAEILRDDERTDLAVLKIDAGGEKLPVIPLGDSDELEVGDLVLAIGNPFGVGQTVTSGIVSGLARTNVGITDFNFFIQTDAAINPGNSGGALLRMDGQLAGINTAIFSRSGGSQGIGFAVPANMVRTVLAGAESGGSLRRPWLGARTQEVTAEIADAIGLERPHGVLVTEIYPDGPADRAGLETGDIIVSINGRSVNDSEALRFRLATGEVGSEAAVSVRRPGRTFSVALPLQTPPEVPSRDPLLVRGRHPLAGATVMNLSPAVAEEMGFDLFTSGVVVATLAKGSPAERLNFEEGDILLALNGRTIGTVDDLRAVLDTKPQAWRVAIRRGGRTLTLVLPS